MSRDKFLLWVVGFLVLLNTATLAYLLWHHKLHSGHHPNGFEPHRPHVHFLEPLQFDERQQEAFEQLVHEHRMQMHRYENQLANLGKQYVALVRAESMDSIQLQMLNDSIAYITTNKNAVTLEHIREVRALCRTEQLPVFDNLLPEFSRLITPQRRMPPPHHHH